MWNSPVCDNGHGWDVLCSAENTGRTIDQKQLQHSLRMCCSQCDYFTMIQRLLRTRSTRSIRRSSKPSWFSISYAATTCGLHSQIYDVMNYPFYSHAAILHLSSEHLHRSSGYSSIYRSIWFCVLVSKFSIHDKMAKFYVRKTNVANSAGTRFVSHKRCQWHSCYRILLLLSSRKRRWKLVHQSWSLAQTRPIATDSI